MELVPIKEHNQHKWGGITFSYLVFTLNQAGPAHSKEVDMRLIKRTTLKLSLTLSAMLIGSLVGSAQEMQSKIESSIKSKESHWELVSKDVRSESTIYDWKSCSDWVTMEAFILDSSQSAKLKMAEFKRRVPVPPKEKSQQSGDEAVLYRRGRIFVKLSSNTLVNAKRFFAAHR
jgi:hypothetical protein